ncbi:MAG: hypothetical protein AAGU02_02610 [Lawsonibacter sp.]
MASNTPNYDLKKPTATDFYHVEDQNTNMDKLDAALKGLADSKAPATHAARHAAGGSDPVTPAAIGAAANGANSDITSLSGLTTALSVPQGGTGKTSWTANQLIYPSAADALAQLPLPSVAGSLLRQGASGAPYWTSPADLATEMGQLKIAYGAYSGTGIYGYGHENSLTFTFRPRLIIINRQASSDLESISDPSILILSHSGMPFPEAGGASRRPVPFSYIPNGTSWTVTWYHPESLVLQFNVASKGYQYTAIGIG